LSNTSVSEKKTLSRIKRWAFARPGYESAWLATPALILVAAAFVLPLGVVAWYSLHKSAYGSLVPGLSLANYIRILTNGAYYETLLASIGFVIGVSLLINVIAFPTAYFVAIHLNRSRRNLFLILAAIPFLTSYLTRVLAWLNILGRDGVLNQLLLQLGLVGHPLEFLSSGRSAVVITFVYLLVPLAFLTIYSALERMDPNLFEAATDLGAGRLKVLTRVVLPLSINGIVTAFALVYVALFGDYITPIMIGGTDGVLFVNLLVNQFGASMQWGFGAAMAVIMLVATFVMLGILKKLGGSPGIGDATRRNVKPAGILLKIYAGLFYAFLYLPLIFLLLLALNTSDVVGLPIQGITLHWFAVAIADPGFQAAVFKSFEIGISSSIIGTSLGALAAIPLARRKGKFRNMGLALLSAPLVMPPVVLGIGMLIGMDSIGMTRGTWTLIVGHSLLALPVALLIVLARLEGAGNSQEVAAMDLGATSLKVLTRITLPQAVPALLAAFLLTLALSLDEFILTFMITGKDMTLPLYFYSSIRFRLSPSIIAGASTVLLMSITLIGIGGFLYSLKLNGRARGDHNLAGQNV